MLNPKQEAKLPFPPAVRCEMRENSTVPAGLEVVEKSVPGSFTVAMATTFEL